MARFPHRGRVTFLLLGQEKRNPKRRPPWAAETLSASRPNRRAPAVQGRTNAARAHGCAEQRTRIAHKSARFARTRGARPLRSGLRCSAATKGPKVNVNVNNKTKRKAGPPLRGVTRLSHLSSSFNVGWVSRFAAYPTEQPNRIVIDAKLPDPHRMNSQRQAPRAMFRQSTPPQRHIRRNTASPIARYAGCRAASSVVISTPPLGLIRRYFRRLEYTPPRPLERYYTAAVYPNILAAV